MNFPDCSWWQGDIDFDVMMTKTDYIILKASQLTIDHKFPRNRSECVRVGLPFGAYHFFDDRSSPSKQANLFVTALIEHPVMPLEIWCDWERNYGGTYSGVGNVVAFMERVEDLLNMQMGMYTGYFYFLENTNRIRDASQLRYLKDRPLWLAWYFDHTPNHAEDVLIPYPWIEMDVYQYGSPAFGREMGVGSEEIDMNKRMTDFTIPSTPSQKSIIQARFGNTKILYEEQ